MRNRPSHRRNSRPGTRLAGTRLPAFGMVDALVGILVLAAVVMWVSASFATIARLDVLQADRIDRLLRESDAASHSVWY